MKAAHPFLAVDGEACEDDYVLMHRTGSHPLTDLRPGGLHTTACLEFLLQAPKPSIQVCFGLGYDVNNWLRDLPRATLENLWATQLCHWRDYKIEWVPKCWFVVSHISGRSAKIYEVFGFFQSSFVKALEAWGIGAPEEIRRMKGERGSFRRADIEAVTTYCMGECEYLVELMGALREACSEAGMLPSSWHGAGAAAAAMLDAHNVTASHRHDLDLCSAPIAQEVVQGAYFGGRVELLHQGVHHHVVAADLKSAYPAAMVDLPSLKGARLVKRKSFNPGRFGVWKVSWDLNRGVPSSSRGAGKASDPADSGPPPLLAPFPVRVKQSIFYPVAGEGIYHTVEVAAALELGYPIDVHWGWVLEGPHTDDRPFAWIPKVYAAREQMKAEGRASEKAIKLGLNSCYGKLAQGPSRFLPTPKFQCYLWAGYITAATRARVLTAAAKARDPIMIATDGIFAKGFAELGPQGGLGTWEREEVDKLFAAQPGVYQATRGGKVHSKSRGFFASEVDYDELEAGWLAEGADHVHQYRSTRFQGLGSSLARKDFSVWREWRTDPRSIVLWPERKIAGENGELLPFPHKLTSEPYKPKITLVEARALEQLEGNDQPMVIEI